MVASCFCEYAVTTGDATMKSRLKPLVATLACLATLSGAALAEESPFSANVGITSDYTYRGISQTNQRPALQGGFDYAHASGFYAGIWGR
jgi:uncharacterized protein (TIGR02001 family)